VAMASTVARCRLSAAQVTPPREAFKTVSAYFRALTAHAAAHDVLCIAAASVQNTEVGHGHALRRGMERGTWDELLIAV
jgi:hypothetical protein